MTYPVPVSVWFDGNNKFMNGQTINIQSDALAIGIVQKPTGPVILGFGPSGLQNTLYVRDRILGGLYLNMTLQQFLTAIGKTAQSANKEKIYTVTIVGTPSSITAVDLYNVTLTQVTIGGIAVDQRTISYSSDDTNKTGTVTFGSSLSSTSVVQVGYYIN